MRIAQARPEALPDERGRQVCGVAEEQHPAHPPPVREPGTEGVLGGPQHLQLRRRHPPRRDELGHPRRARQLLGGLVRAHAELPPVTVTRQWQEGRRPPGTADLLDPAPGRDRPRGADVHDEPPVGEPQVVQPAPDGGPHCTARAVAADHGLRAHRFRATRTGQLHADRGGCVRGLVEPGHLGADPEVHQRVADELGAQHPIQVRLVEQVGLRVPMAPGGAVAAELGEGAQPRVHQPQPGGGTADPREGIGQADALEHAHRLVVQVHRPGQRVDVAAPLDHRARHAEPGKQQRDRAAGRTRADDQDRYGSAHDRILGHRHRPSTWSPTSERRTCGVDLPGATLVPRQPNSPGSCSASRGPHDRRG